MSLGTTILFALPLNAWYHGWQIEYEDEDPIIRKTFEEEWARSGAEVKMAPAAGRAN